MPPEHDLFALKSPRHHFNPPYHNKIFSKSVFLLKMHSPECFKFEIEGVFAFESNTSLYYNPAHGVVEEH